MGVVEFVRQSVRAMNIGSWDLVREMVVRDKVGVMMILRTL